MITDDSVTLNSVVSDDPPISDKDLDDFIRTSPK